MRRRITELIDKEINPYVASHGGKIEVVDFVDGDVHVKMMGGCMGCAHANETLRMGVEKALRDAFGDEIRNVVDVTMHEAGTSPFYPEPD